MESQQEGIFNMYKKADYDVKVSAVDITPYPVARGKPASFNIFATIGTSIFGGKLVIEVSYFGWHIHIETYDLFAETSCFNCFSVLLCKGCSENCSIRPYLQWIKSPESQANATVFLAKFYGRVGLMNLINVGPEHLCHAIF
ncbi:hypothetical protein COP2_007462 [Malus domestica]